MTKIIKRYKNRKLYDTYESRYVTVKEIGEMARAGQDFKILTEPLKLDITREILLRSLVEREECKNISEDFLRIVLQSSDGSFSGFITSKIEKKEASSVD